MKGKSLKNNVVYLIISVTLIQVMLNDSQLKTFANQKKNKKLIINLLLFSLVIVIAIKNSTAQIGWRAFEEHQRFLPIASKMIRLNMKSGAKAQLWFSYWIINGIHWIS
ncbi:hypothetical protein BpHYR1_025024, partial [Brachionus plicatilis]